MAETSGALMRAGSWQPQGETVLLKTASDVFAQLHSAQQAKAHPRVAEVAAVAEAGKTNSVDSSSTAAGRGGAHHGLLVDSATAGLGLPPLRQISLDVLAATDMMHSKAMGGPPERNSIFQDVFNELAGKDELAPLQGGQLYTLPSMQFLESMLNDFDSKTGSNSGSGAAGGGPLYLAGDAFDLPDFHHSTHHASHHGHPVHLAHHPQQPGLRPTPFDQQQAAHAQLLHAQQAYGGGDGVPMAAGAASYSFVPMGGSAPAHLAPMPAGSSASGSVTLQASMRAHSAYVASHPDMVPLPADEAALGRRLAVLQQQQAAALAARQPAPHQAAPGVRGPAAPQPAQPRATPRRQSHSSAYADFDYEEAEVSLQTSKSGRVRKVASFTGVKRKLDVGSHANGSDSRDSRGSVGADTSAGEVGSKSKGARKGAGGGAKNRKGRRTICLNCGCHQTPQWRCGPLGPRTLCNACGVRYKKDLPLNCWPIRDGMMLPPGAVLPPGFVVPPGITIHTQPAELE